MKLSVIAPTFNERENIRALVEQVQDALPDMLYEIIIADDDSPDLTWQMAQEISARDPKVRVLRRTRNHGLGRAVMEGFTAAAGDIVACMDADLQHDPSVLPKMLEKLTRGADVVIGSRYATGGSTGDWNWFRRLGSRLATMMARILLGVKLTDPMSGYFMMRRNDFLRVHPSLKGEGFKILLEVLVKLRPGAIEEVPYRFRRRLNGASKLSSKVVFQYVRQLWELAQLRQLLPARFIRFVLVGCTGIVVNLAAMALLLKLTDWRGWVASVVASLIANLNNYGLNNVWTFSDRAHRGFGLLKGYVSYLLMSTVGLGITTASYIGLAWTVAQFPLGKVDWNRLGIALFCQFLAIALGTFSNYILNKGVTWPGPARNDVHCAENLPFLNSGNTQTVAKAGFDCDPSSGQRPLL
ncbi:MAG TPA: glycosyltransferase [Terriglobales bacterium]|nr:MAG: hypothetical protein AUG13_02650 [Chloroflexi bacterium 13_1_20CM_2_59_7]HLB86187.1 glycosyltransferase [Terriglobales bacterium]